LPRFGITNRSAGGLHAARGQEDAPQNLAATRLMVFAHTNRFRAEDPQYFSDTGGRR
jgi:hypothetical protein